MLLRQQVDGARCLCPRPRLTWGPCSSNPTRNTPKPLEHKFRSQSPSHTPGGGPSGAGKGGFSWSLGGPPSTSAASSIELRLTSFFGGRRPLARGPSLAWRRGSWCFGAVERGPLRRRRGARGLAMPWGGLSSGGGRCLAAGRGPRGPRLLDCGGPLGVGGPRRGTWRLRLGDP